jgi:hypothetical protein
MTTSRRSSSIRAEAADTGKARIGGGCSYRGAQPAERKSAWHEGRQQPLVFDDPPPVLGHLLDSRDVGDELGEEQIRAIAVTNARDFQLGKSYMLGVAFDRLDERAGTAGEAERRIAKTAPDFKKPFRAYRACEDGQERTTRRRIHGAPCTMLGSMAL